MAITGSAGTLHPCWGSLCLLKNEIYLSVRCLWIWHLMDDLAPEWCMRYQTKWRDFPWFLLISFSALLDHTPNCKRQGKIFQKLQWVCFEPCQPHSSCTLTESLLWFLIIFASLATSLLSGHISLFIPIYFIFISFYSHLFLVHLFLYPLFC